MKLTAGINNFSHPNSDAKISSLERSQSNQIYDFCIQNENRQDSAKLL